MYESSRDDSVDPTRGSDRVQTHATPTQNRPMAISDVLVYITYTDDTERANTVRSQQHQRDSRGSSPMDAG
jgi:hypothetical protein